MSSEWTGKAVHAHQNNTMGTEEHGSSLVRCLTRDRGVVGSSLT